MLTRLLALLALLSLPLSAHAEGPTGAEAAAPLPLPERPGVRMQTVSFGLGGTVGVGATSGGWVIDGQVPGRSWYAAGSPVASAAMEVGGERARWLLGLEAQPLFLYRVGYDVLSIDVIHLRTGAMFGSDDLRVGPTVFGGLLAAGAGGRLVWSPWVGSRGRRHGLDLRAEYMLGGDALMRVTALYSVAPWPRLGGEPR